MKYKIVFAIIVLVLIVCIFLLILRRQREEAEELTELIKGLKEENSLLRKKIDVVTENGFQSIDKSEKISLDTTKKIKAVTEWKRQREKDLQKEFSTQPTEEQALEDFKDMFGLD